jgi:putative membrane protein
MFWQAMLGLSLGFAGVNSALADSTDKGALFYGHPMWSGGWTWGHMFMGWGMMAVFLIVMIVVVVLLTRGSGSDAGRSGDTSSAMDILNERYARGEIDSAEYQERKNVISGKS